MRRFLLSIVLVFGIAGPAEAAFITGNKLFEFCQARSGTAKHVYCLGYIVGVADTVDDPFVSNVLPSRAKICIPDKLQSNQLKDVVFSYLEKNPQERNFEAQVLTIFALSEAFPCKENKARVN